MPSPPPPIDTVLYIRLSDITDIGWETDPDEVREMRDYLLQHGSLQIIDVAWYPDGTIEVTDGLHRYDTYSEEHTPEVRCRVVTHDREEAAIRRAQASLGKKDTIIAARALRELGAIFMREVSALLRAGGSYFTCSLADDGTIDIKQVPLHGNLPANDPVGALELYYDHHRAQARLEARGSVVKTFRWTPLVESWLDKMARNFTPRADRTEWEQAEIFAKKREWLRNRVVMAAQIQRFLGLSHATLPWDADMDRLLTQLWNIPDRDIRELVERRLLSDSTENDRALIVRYQGGSRNRASLGKFLEEWNIALGFVAADGGLPERARFGKADLRAMLVSQNLPAILREAKKVDVVAGPPAPQRAADLLALRSLIPPDMQRTELDMDAVFGRTSATMASNLRGLASTPQSVLSISAAPLPMATDEAKHLAAWSGVAPYAQRLCDELRRLDQHYGDWRTWPQARQLRAELHVIFEEGGEA